MDPPLSNAWVGSTRSRQLRHLENDEHQNHENQSVPGNSGMSTNFLLDYKYLREEQGTRLNSLLSELNILYQSPDLDLIKNQIMSAQIFNELSLLNANIESFPPKMVNLWLLPAYTKGQTVLYSNLTNMECHSLSAEEDFRYQCHQVNNIIKHDINGLGLHSVKAMANVQDFVDIIREFVADLQFHLPAQIFFLGHGHVSDNLPVYSFDDKEANLKDILAFLDDTFGSVSCQSKPKIVLAFCQAHLFDQTQYAHIQVEILTNTQHPQTRIVFDTNHMGQIIVDTIIHEQLVTYVASQLRREIEIIFQTFRGSAADLCNSNATQALLVENCFYSPK